MIWPAHGVAGAFLVAVGEALILARARPLSDFYFPFVWLGYILLLDAAVFRQTGRSLWMNARLHFLAMLPISAAFWWLFELFNETVHNWTYIGTSSSDPGHVAFASIDFATVLLAVWCSALFIAALLPDRPASRSETSFPLPVWTPGAMFCAGIAAIAAAVLWPSYFFGALWLCMFFLLDPINDRLGRPSMLAAVRARNWRVPAAFALGGLMCGFFWEGWNFWAMPKWIYTIPYVNHWHVFEMPLLGWSGYLPFGLELFAMANFVFWVLKFPPLGLTLPSPLEATAGRAERGDPLGGLGVRGPTDSSSTAPAASPATPSARRTECSESSP
jgi:hypothetical protein